MSNEEFPATAWLGYSLDMSATTPMDINAVCELISDLSRPLI
jgi:hypothetical protein